MDQIRQQMMQNPEMLQQALDNPLVQSITSNPEMMQSIMMQNPQMQQLVEVIWKSEIWLKFCFRFFLFVFSKSYFGKNIW